MDAQLEKAVEIAWDPQSGQNLKQQAFQFIEHLRGDSQAWQLCYGLFSRRPRTSDPVRLVCLDLINHSVRNQNLDDSSLTFLKNSLLEYIRQCHNGDAETQQDPTHIQNKLTQTLTYLFMALYGKGWESFLDDFLALAFNPNSSQPDNAAGVLMYLRVLGSVHDEIADVITSRQGNDAKRNSELKDLIRDRDMRKISNSWREILALYANQNDVVVELTLKVIAKWVSWIDISLVINQEMLNLLWPFVGRTNPAGSEDRVRDAAIETLNEIVAKKMKLADKADMISFLNLRDIITQLIASPPLNEFKGTSRYDNELAEVVAKLVNTIMTDIVRMLEEEKVDDQTRAKAEQHLRDFLPCLLRFFSDEYDEICSAVIPSLTDLLTFFRKVGDLPSAYSVMLSPILSAIIMKMRYDETSNWGQGDDQTDEAEFQELRKRLQNLQKSVAAVDQNLYMETLSSLVANTFSTLDQQGSQMDWRDLDLALHELYLFGELALPNAGHAHKSQPNPVAAEGLIVMMSKMVESGIANFPHPAILLQYMEICVRYCQFFEVNHSYIPQVLENFVRLMHHNHARLKTRSWYLFHRFVKHLRAQVGNVTETIIQSIRDLLPIKAEISGNDAGEDMSSDESDHSADALFSSQLYLFEAIGCISSTNATPVEKRALYARTVMQPLFADVEAHLPRAKAGDVQSILQIHHIVMALGTLANGFSDWHPGQTERPPPAKEVAEEFSRAAEAILVALTELNTNGEIRTACRSAFSRIINVLGNAVLPQLPQWIDGLLSQSSSKDEMALFLRVLEQVVFGFKSEIYTVLDQLLTPLLGRIFAGLSEDVGGTDDEIQLQELRREYLAFIQVILGNNLGGVLVSETNQSFFESLITSILVLAKTVVHGNMAASKLGFVVLSKMAAQWGGADVATIAANPAAPTGPPQPAIPGFDQFMIERFHSVCWEVLRNPDFKPFADAQSRQVLNEIAGLEQTIYTKTGDAFIQHLQAVTFPRYGIQGTDFLRAMTTAVDRKGLTNYLMNLLKSWR